MRIHHQKHAKRSPRAALQPAWQARRVSITAGLGTAGVGLALSLVSGCAGPPAADPSGRAPESQELVEGEPLFDVLPKDEIRAIDAASFVDADTADPFMALDEPVLGIVGRQGTAKAYSAWHLDTHEIVNDVLDGEPIAATW